MLVTRYSPFSGTFTTVELPVTEEQMAEMDLPSTERRHIQDIFPDLTPSEREFIKTGYTQADWAAMFPPEESEEFEDCPHCGRTDMPIGECESDDCPSNEA